MSKIAPNAGALKTALIIFISSIPLSLIAKTSALPYSCEWISEVTPAARIVFNKKDGVGSFKGHLVFNGKPLTTFSEGQFLGYGSNWWSIGSPKSSDGIMVVFTGNTPVNGSPHPKQLKGPQRVLLVGLGSNLYYGSNQWRTNPVLLNAAEGFWRTLKGCRPLHR